MVVVPIPYEMELGHGTDFEGSSLGLWSPEGEMWRGNCRSEPKW